MPVPDLTTSVPLAYVGFGPGQELIPYFWALLTFLAAALVAIVQWPITKLRGVLARERNRSQSNRTDVPS